MKVKIIRSMARAHASVVNAGAVVEIDDKLAKSWIKDKVAVAVSDETPLTVPGRGYMIGKKGTPVLAPAQKSKK